MVDLSLDLNPADIGTAPYRDLIVKSNDLVLTSDADPNGTNPILQDILTRMRFFLGEWYLDSTQGVPWLQRILIKNPSQSDIDGILLNVIAGTPGVTQVSTWSFTPNKAARTLKITFTCQTTKGPVSYSGTLSPVGANAV